MVDGDRPVRCRVVHSTRQHTRIFSLPSPTLLLPTLLLFLHLHLLLHPVEAHGSALAPGDALATALGNLVTLNAGTVTAGDVFDYAALPCMYLEAENVTCAQCSWGIGGTCPYLFQVNTSAPAACSVQPSRPGYDLPGNDYAATPLPADNATLCSALCCAEMQCAAWTYAPAAPSNYFGCTTGQHCCYRKFGAPTWTPNPAVPGIVSGFVNKTGPPPFPPPLGMRSAVPLGGLGAGALELRADGSVHEVTLMNASPAGAAKFGVLADMVAAVQVAAGSGGTLTRTTKTLRTAPPAWAGTAGGVDAITYSGAYPAAALAVTDADLNATGVAVTLYAYSTLAPGDMVASGAPAVFFTLVASNTGPSAVNASLFLTAPFPAINNCARPTNASLGPAFPTPSAAACLQACAAATSASPACASWTWCANTAACTLAANVPWAVYSATSYCGVAGAWSSPDGTLLNYVQAPPAGAGGPAAGDMSLLPVAGGGGAVGVADTPGALYAAFASMGGLPAASPGVSAGGGPFSLVPAAVGAAVATVTLAPGATASASITLAWYFPDRDHMGVNIGNYYGTVWESSVGVANAYATPAALASVVTALNAHHAVFASPASPLPPWVQDYAINEMSHFRGLIWTADGRLREFEANDCPDVDSQHNDAQRRQPYLWVLPQFEYSKMAEWAMGQGSDGHLPEYLGSFSLSPLDTPGGRIMADTTTVWIMELLELYQLTGDAAFLQEMYPVAVRALQWQIAASAAIGLPWQLQCTYDILALNVYNSTTFNTMIHLAAMRAGAALAAAMNDSATAAAADAAYSAAQAATAALLWNDTAGYYRAYIGGDAVMADSLYGQMLGHRLGFGFFVDAANLSQHLAAEAAYNANAFGFTVLTGRHEPPPTGSQIDTQDDVDWMGGGPTWSYMQVALGTLPLDAALAPTQASVENWRSRLRDWWNIAGITTSGDWGDDNQVGQPYVTSHYGFLLPNYHLLPAITGQQTNLPAGSLTFAPRYPCPYTLPLLLAGTTGTIGCTATPAVTYTVALAFGSLTLPPRGLVIDGSPYPAAVDLVAGASLSWSPT